MTFAAGGAAGGFATGVAASAAAAIPTLGGSIVISPATVTATTVTGLTGGALVGLAKDVHDNAQAIANGVSSIAHSVAGWWRKVKETVGTAIGLSGGHQVPGVRMRPEDEPPPPAPTRPAPAKGKPPIRVETGPDGTTTVHVDPPTSQ